MQKWEYLIVAHLMDEKTREFHWHDDENDNRSKTERLNALGEEGWELVTTDKGYMGDKPAVLEGVRYYV
jgi:hypothetical protein